MGEMSPMPFLNIAKYVEIRNSMHGPLYNPDRPDAYRTPLALSYSLQFVRAWHRSRVDSCPADTRRMSNPCGGEKQKNGGFQNETSSYRGSDFLVEKRQTRRGGGESNYIYLDGN